jgi:predicted NBD/HSP70 family sugar kinase
MSTSAGRRARSVGAARTPDPPPRGGTCAEPARATLELERQDIMRTLLTPVIDDIDDTDGPSGDGRRTRAASVVLRSILDNGPVARSTVARLTGLSGAAVSRQCADLARLGLVRERPTRSPRSSVGRPHVPVDIDTRRHLVCGIHIALLHCTYVLTDLRGRVLAERRIPHRDPGPAAVLAAIGDTTESLLAEYTAGRRLLGVGVATGGWVDPARGTVVRHSQLGWSEVAVRAALQDRLGQPVRVESHSRALARAEQLIGAHRDRARQSLVHLFVGNVVDAALATGGVVHHGPRSAAGDVSHLPVGSGSVLGPVLCGCGRTGCVQAGVGDQAMARHAVSAGLLARPVFADLLASLEAGNAGARSLFRDRARLVGRAAAMLLDVVNPEILVVTEAGVVRDPELLAELRGEVAERSRVCTDPERTVVASSFGSRALGVAAGSVVLDATYAHPLDLRPSPAQI